MSDSRDAITAVLFDAFGTLITLHKPVRALVAALGEVGSPNPPSAVASALLTEVAYYRRKQDTGRDAASLAALRRQCAEVFCSTLPNPPETSVATRILVDSLRYRPFDDAIPTLDRLRAAGVRVGVVSNFDVSLGEVMEDTGLAPFVDVLATSAVVGSRKPDPGLFTAALDELGVDPSAALHCGDRRDEDALGAAGAGIRPVLLERDPGVDPDPEFTTVRSLTEVADLVLGEGDPLSLRGDAVSPAG